MNNDLQVIIDKQKESFLTVLSDKTINFEREANFALQALTANSFLAGVALKNPMSLAAAIRNVASIGISLNPASRLAYLVPRDGKVCLDISYMGLMHIAQQSGAIQWGQAAIVREHDEFELRGVDKEPHHKHNPFSTERGEIIGVYVVVKTDTGDYLTHAMPISKVNDIRDRSSAWKAWVERKAKCPWVTDYEEMVKKTCIKQAAKMWPRRDRLDAAVLNLNTELEEGIDTRDVTEYTTGQLDILTQLSDAADNGMDALHKRFTTLQALSDLGPDAGADIIKQRKHDISFVWKTNGEILKNRAQKAQVAA